MKPVHVMSSTYIDFNVENNSKNPKFEDGDDAKILKYNNILQEITLQIGLKKFL